MHQAVVQSRANTIRHCCIHKCIVNIRVTVGWCHLTACVSDRVSERARKEGSEEGRKEECVCRAPASWKWAQAPRLTSKAAKQPHPKRKLSDCRVQNPGASERLGDAEPADEGSSASCHTRHPKASPNGVSGISGSAWWKSKLAH